MTASGEAGGARGMGGGALPLVIYGAGDHGRVVAEAARLAGWRVLGFLDDRVAAGEEIGGAPVLGAAERLAGIEAAVIVAVGENAHRWDLIKRVEGEGARLAAVVHPAAAVSESATVGRGVFIGAQAVVNAEAELRAGAIVNSGAVVEHHAVVGEAAHVGPGAVVTGRSQVGERALVGAGAVVLPGRAIGAAATVGAGAVVTADVLAGATVAGNPARPMDERAAERGA